MAAKLATKRLTVVYTVFVQQVGIACRKAFLRIPAHAERTWRVCRKGMSTSGADDTKTVVYYILQFTYPRLQARVLFLKNTDDTPCF